MKKEVTRTEWFESWGMKKQHSDKFALKPTDVYYYWDCDPNYPPYLNEDYKKRSKAKGVGKLLMAIEYFAEYAGVNGPEEVEIYYSAESSYYDSYEIRVRLSVSRKELPHEFEERKHLAVAEAEKKRETARKAQETKEKNEREQYERLKKKFETSRS